MNIKSDADHEEAIKRLTGLMDDIQEYEEANRPIESTLWQPIETAPKDGTEIIVSGGSWGSDSVSCEFEAVFKKSACVWWDEGSWNRWCEVDDKTTYYMPTHWQPMPKPVNS